MVNWEETLEYNIDSKLVDIFSFFVDRGICSSKGEARRLISQGGLSINKVKVPDGCTHLEINGNKLEFVKIKHEG